MTLGDGLSVSALPRYVPVYTAYHPVGYLRRDVAEIQTDLTESRNLCQPVVEVP